MGTRVNGPARIAHLPIHEWRSCYLNSSRSGFQKQNNGFHDNFWSIAPQYSWQSNTCWWRHHRWAPGFFFYPLLDDHMDLPEYKSDLHLFILLNLVLIFLNAICFVFQYWVVWDLSFIVFIILLSTELSRSHNKIMYLAGRLGWTRVICFFYLYFFNLIIRHLIC